MKRLSAILGVCLTVATFASAGDKDKDKYPRMTVEQLVNAAHGMDGKKIVVLGCYNSGFEWNYLFPCENPEDKSKWVWVVESPDFKGRKMLKDTSMGYCRVEVLGTLETGSTYGHLNGYRYQLNVYRVYSFGTKQKFEKHPN